MTSFDADSAKYVQQASKVDSFMGKIRYAKSKGQEAIAADKFIFDHFVGADYALPMFCIEGIEVYQLGKETDWPADVVAELTPSK